MADLIVDRTLYDKAYEGDLRAVQAAVEAVPEGAERRKFVNKRDSDGRCLLHWAAAGGHVELVEYLLRTDGVRVNARDESQWTPLLSAASAGHLAVVRKLLAAGADATLANDSGRIPLHYHRGNIDMIDLLLPVTGDVDCRDDSGSTPLARAAGPGHVDAMRALLGAGAKPNLQDKYGNTALHFACEERRDTAAILLVENGARLAVKNREKKTPLELATPALQASLISIARGGAGGAGGIE